ncbi:alpha/beta fold hydrolase [Williamsia sterculiae]|nr:alpha/beta hydrolase [Williamsia sterculiae]
MTLRSVVVGHGDPTRVWVHGLGAMGAPYYFAVLHEPQLRHGRNIVVDLPGHGLSDRPETFGYEIEDQADALAEVIADVADGPVELVAHSMGGSVAIVVSHRHPHLVRSLVLIDPNLDPLVATRGHPGSRGIAAWTERDFVEASDGEIEDLVGSAWWATMRLASRAALHRAATSLIRERDTSFRLLLECVSCPRLLVYPQADGDYPGGATLTDAGVSLVAIPDCGHNVMLDNPSALAEAVGGARSLA